MITIGLAITGFTILMLIGYGNKLKAWLLGLVIGFVFGTIIALLIGAYAPNLYGVESRRLIAYSGTNQVFIRAFHGTNEWFGDSLYSWIEEDENGIRNEVYEPTRLVELRESDEQPHVERPYAIKNYKAFRGFVLEDYGGKYKFPQWKLIVPPGSIQWENRRPER